MISLLHPLSNFVFIILIIISSGGIRSSDSARVFTIINNCKETIWRGDCPSELAVKAKGKVVGCRSACDVFNTDEYCCRGVYGNSMTCRPTFYSQKFKSACPTAYSYAYDDPTSIFTCTAADYVVSFCSSRNQPVCSYHNQKLVCSGSNGLKSFIGGWGAAVMAAFLFMVNSRIIF
ncbi:thaumatin-like protein 1 [Momordica charantia]|uniref:Thaumatin-like protein 1 n=1 Tax=Momordica charantia TaxID=3673 RepID=A0A6J1CL57_MOMCH|nr:thaumatin-like protein 1 [Momordica charantia]